MFLPLSPKRKKEKKSWTHYKEAKSKWDEHILKEQKQQDQDKI